jgi:hypothetical protein
MKSATPPNPDGRAQQRTRIYGRANLALPGGSLLTGTIYDMTHNGISVLLDCRLTLHKPYLLQINIYRNGKLHLLRLQAQCVHETLSGSQGFRHGFQFATHSEALRQALTDVLA